MYYGPDPYLLGFRSRFADVSAFLTLLYNVCNQHVSQAASAEAFVFISSLIKSRPMLYKTLITKYVSTKLVSLCLLRSNV